MATASNHSELKKHIERRLRNMETERKSWEPVWRDVADHFLPNKTRFLDAGDRTNDGSDRRNTKLFDSTGRLALRTLASGMHAGLTSQSRDWFKLALPDELMMHEEPKLWLHDTYKRMVTLFRNSNFYEQIHTLYGELAATGTGCMFVEEDADAVVRFKTLTAGEYVLDTDASGRVNTLYRRIRMTAVQIVESWPETCPQEIKDKADKDSLEWIEIIHAVEPNKEHKEGRKDAKSRQFLSVYMLSTGEKTILEESGYYEFPALCPRWETTGSDIYGRSPAMDVLPDCRMLQRMTKDGLEALELEVRPPLNVQGLDRPNVDLSPAALNYVPALSPGQPAITPLYQVRANLQALEATKETIKNQIKEGLFYNLFLMLSNIDRAMTATEVAERNGEKMLMLGPVLDRMRSELFQPLITRVGGIMTRRGLLAVPPEYLENQPIEIEFVSILAQAQKQAGISSIQQVVAFIGQLAQLNPAVLDKLDVDQSIDEIAEMLGVSPSIIRSDEALEALRAQREQQTQQAQMMNAMQQGAGIAKDGADALGKAGFTPEMLQEAMSGAAQ